VMAQRAAVHAGVHRLLGGEVPGLRLCLSVEPIVIYVRHIEDISTQNHDFLALSGSALMGEEQVEDRFGLLAPELVVQCRSGRCLLDRHASLQIAGRGRGPAIVAWPPLALLAPDTSTSAGLGSQVMLHNREQICPVK